MERRSSRTIAVAIHEIEPATFERCALVRDWLADHGVARVTLLVIPARDLHPLGDRSPEMVAWLRDCAARGDAIAQHGFQHTQLRRGSRNSPEFLCLDGAETRRAVEAGWRVLKLAGIEPSGFVAPAYAYTAPLRGLMRERFRWWAGALRLHSRGSDRIAPAFGLSDASALRRALSPALVRAGALACGQTMRLDLHPGDLAHPRHIIALDDVLHRAARERTAVTYDQLAA